MNFNKKINEMRKKSGDRLVTIVSPMPKGEGVREWENWLKLHQNCVFRDDDIEIRVGSMEFNGKKCDFSAYFIKQSALDREGISI